MKTIPIRTLGIFTLALVTLLTGCDQNIPDSPTTDSPAAPARQIELAKDGVTDFVIVTPANIVWR